MEKNLKTLLSSHNFTFKKAYGQNFLTDQALLSQITDKAGVNKDVSVIEIGCGAGALTAELAKKAKKVFGYEIDVKLKPVLEDALKDFSNVNITFADVMKEKMGEIERKVGGEYLLVANLPYYITTPVIMNFLENAKNMRSMTVMVQKEVADRLCSKEHSGDYGAITVAINLRGNAQIIEYVGREMFTPMPNVDSAVVKIDIEKDKFSGVDFEKVRDVVRCAFISRRKMLVNNLMNYYKFSRIEAENVLTNANLSLTCRGEELTAEQFVELSGVIKDNGK